MKKTFLLNYKKYEGFKKKSIAEIEGSAFTGFSPLLEEMRKVAQKSKDAEVNVDVQKTISKAKNEL